MSLIGREAKNPASTPHALVLVAIALFTGLSCAIGYGFGRGGGLGRPEGVAICIEACFRNTNLALLVKASAFPVILGVADPFADAVFYVLLMYGGMALPVATVPLLLRRRALRRKDSAS